MPLHSAMASADVHEPKHITNTTVAETGKVITPSSSVNATSELRYLDEAEIDGVVDVYTLRMADVSTAETLYLVPAYAGTIESIKVIIANAITVADTTVTTSVAGTPVTGGAVTLAFTGSGAGTIFTATPTAGHTVTTSSIVTFAGDGGSTTSCVGIFVIKIKRS